MPKYQFSVEAVISMSTDVEAATLEEAIAEAQSRGVQGLCHQCAHGNYAEEWATSGELDCEPAVSKLAAVYCDGEELAEGSLEALQERWDAAP